jgi:pullulanase
MPRTPVPASTRMRLLTLVAVLAILAATPIFGLVRPAQAAGSTVQLSIHYWRSDGQYTSAGSCPYYANPSDTQCGWNVYVWDYSGGGPGAAYKFTGADSFGEVAKITVPCTTCTTMGFIIRDSTPTNQWAAKDTPNDRHLPVTSGAAEVWVDSGDATNYYTEQAAVNARGPHVQAAFLDGPKRVTAGLSDNFTPGAGGSGITLRDVTAKKTIKATAAVSGGSGNVVIVTLKSAPRVKDDLMVSIPGFAGGQVIPRDVLDGSHYYYSGPLGASYSKKSTAFNVWAPTASAVKLQLFKKETGKLTKAVAMKAVKGGDWHAVVTGKLKNWYYLYAVTIDGMTNTGVDPYATGIAVNGARAMVVDLKGTNPSGWSADKHVGVANPVDASVYEADVRDFTIDPNSGVSTADRGKYLGFAQTGTTGPGGVSTGLDSLKQLGVGDVELMPTYHFNSVNETDPLAQNWGYDPQNYNVPEGQYATNPHGPTRVTEYKKMVEGIHKAGMGVLFDGVYTHVYSAGVFDPFVPDYYVRTDDFGNDLNGTGAGPDVAIDRPMVRRFVEDSMKYWVRQYHVDGFRLDWMSLYGRTSMAKISADLHKLFPGIIIFGEPWESTGDEVSGGLSKSEQITEGNQQGLGVAVLNDHVRNAICCDAFSENAAYADGAPTAPVTGAPGTTVSAMLGVEKGVVGSTTYSPTINDFAAAPSQTLNYATNHDGYTLWDRINLKTDVSQPVPIRIAMDEFAQAIVLTSQGIPEILSGEEMLRTKQNNANSYNAGDAVNEIDWSLKQTNSSVFAYYAGLFHLRAAHPAFRMTTAARIRNNLTFLSTPSPTIGFELNGSAVGDSWSHIIVIYNPLTNPYGGVQLPVGTWDIVGTAGQVGTSTLGTASGTITLPPATAVILHD